VIQAALKADQNIKLSIFATRPAIFVPLYNFITEMMGTAMLLLGALLIELSVNRGEMESCFFFLSL
jgi:glycerol uptake facilitator-like aquaporin